MSYWGSNYSLIRNQKDDDDEFEDKDEYELVRLIEIISWQCHRRLLKVLEEKK